MVTKHIQLIKKLLSERYYLAHRESTRTQNMLLPFSVPDSSFLNVSFVVPPLMSIFCFVKSKYKKGNMVLKSARLSNVPSPYSLFLWTYFRTSSKHVSYQ